LETSHSRNFIASGKGHPQDFPTLQPWSLPHGRWASDSTGYCQVNVISGVFLLVSWPTVRLYREVSRVGRPRRPTLRYAAQPRRGIHRQPSRTWR
jgi:hypothetical protein